MGRLRLRLAETFVSHGLRLFVLRVNHFLILPYLEKGYEALVDGVTAADHGAYKVHRIVTDVIELIIFARFAHIRRLSYYLLAVLVNEGYLSTLQQGHQGR